MSDFIRELAPFTELAPGVRRIVAPNPSMMTGPGTNTYLFGVSEVAVVDPGPDLPIHLDSVIGRAGAPIRWILATHTHPDHSPGVAPLAEKTGAEVLGLPAPPGEHQDTTFRPTRTMQDGDRLDTGEFELEAIHTPGHASNHLCFRHDATNWIVTGDHVIDGSTVVINPPDGDMSQYLESLRKVKARRPDALLPGHGDRIDDPDRAIDWILAHRLKREARVERAVGEHPGLSTHELVPLVYVDVPAKLYGWAERSLLAHLIKLEKDGAIVRHGENWRPA